jgi:hypothetical protein
LAFPKALIKTPPLYLLISLILTSGHRFFGKILAIIALIAILRKNNIPIPKFCWFFNPIPFCGAAFAVLFSILPFYFLT